jgi:hypothetical protein
MPDTHAQTGDGLLLIANGIDAMLRWDGFTGTAEPAGLIAPTTGVTAGGSGVGSLTGTYIAYVSYIRADGFESALSPVSGTFLLASNAQVDYSAIPVSPDSRVVARRIYRNTDGQLLTVYRDVQIDNNFATTATSTTADLLLAQDTAFALFDNQGISQTANNSPPLDVYAYVQFHLGFVFAAGSVDYAEGSVEAVAGSNIVTGRGTEWRSNWAGRQIYIDGADGVYDIDSVDETNQTITLTANYGGSTNLFAGYTVRPLSGYRNTLAFTLANVFEAWPPQNGLPIPEEDDELTGLMSLYGFLYILKRRSIYRFTSQSNPAKDGFIFASTKRGCINNRCWVVVDDKAYILDDRGVHMFTGGQQAEDVSNQIQDIFRDNSETPINWAASRYFHAAHSPGEQCIRFFVALRGDYLSHHALCYSYALQHWWTDEIFRPIGASVLGQANRRAHGWGSGGEGTFYGSDANEIFFLSNGSPDVVGSSTCVPGTVISGGLNTVLVTGSVTADMLGAPIVYRSKDDQVLQTRKVVAISGQSLTVHPPWLKVPEEGGITAVGGFAYQYRTQQMRWANTEKNDERSVEIFFGRRPGSLLDVAIDNDFSGYSKSGVTVISRDNFGVGSETGRSSQRIDMSKREAFGIIRLDGFRETLTDGRRVMRLQLTGVGGNGAEEIDQIVIKGVAV